MVGLGAVLLQGEPGEQRVLGGAGWRRVMWCCLAASMTVSREGARGMRVPNIRI